MLSFYTVQLDEKDDDGHKHFVVLTAFDEAPWHKRRSTDGFVLLVAHADLPQSAAEMVALSRSKDAVDKDFQTIKGELELRPVFHNPKVRAHVSLCMLALLLERATAAQSGQGHDCSRSRRGARRRPPWHARNRA